jgi:hypothetical protein
MANREACEVFIDQEIADGLKKGKKPYTIGKELSKWIVKLFEVRIEPRTIEQRARRADATKDATNVAKESETPMDKGSTKVTWDSGKGGKREGAGRPKQVQIELPSSIFPPNTERDREFFAEFIYPIQMISTCTFTAEECHKRTEEWDEEKNNYFKITLKLLNAVAAKGIPYENKTT